MPMGDRYKQINLRMLRADIADIDAERGMIPREAWLRHLIDLGRSEARHAKAEADHLEGNCADGDNRASSRADSFRNATQGKRKR